MHFTRKDINELEKIKRINLINSITGIKPANLVGTASAQGDTNLAIISSVVHMGSHPPLIGFIMRPTADVERHTYDNIVNTERYTINHVATNHIEPAHYTSAKFEQSVSEFDACGFTAQYAHDFHAPYVGESTIKFGLSLEELVDIKLNQTKMIIGRIEHVYIDDQCINDVFQLDLEASKGVGVSGLNTYYRLQKMNSFPYARVSEWEK